MRRIVLTFFAVVGLGCQTGSGLCSGTLVPCGQIVCADLMVDSINCGACGNVCLLSETCQDGACSCRPETTQCGNLCSAVQSDPRHCGTCGHACGASEVCESGVCTTGCMLGQTDCGGACVNTVQDTLNCGGCNQPCGPGQACNGGVCS